MRDCYPTENVVRHLSDRSPRFSMKTSQGTGGKTGRTALKRRPALTTTVMQSALFEESALLLAVLVRGRRLMNVANGMLADDAESVDENRRILELGSRQECDEF